MTSLTRPPRKIRWRTKKSSLNWPRWLPKRCDWSITPQDPTRIPCSTHIFAVGYYLQYLYRSRKPFPPRPLAHYRAASTLLFLLAVLDIFSPGLLSLFIQATRSLMRKMGQLSAVPIEPNEQTRLLDRCSNIKGVIGAGVPGGEFIQVFYF